MKLFHKLRNVNFQEGIAITLTLAVFIFTPIWVCSLELRRDAELDRTEVKVFHLTGLGSQGRWTLENVRGYNYWWKNFSHAEIKLDVGDSVLIRFYSADVAHAFYAPTLNIGPVYIEPGKVETATFRVKSPGEHYYYCMAFCGECHFFMRGKIVVGEEDDLLDSLDLILQMCAHDLKKPDSDELSVRGRYLFNKMGCIACHGPGGGGGVVNPNYVKGTVPNLRLLFRTLSLEDQNDAKILSDLIEVGMTIEQMEGLQLGIANQDIVIAKYQTVRDVIRRGRDAARADVRSFLPPLSMPAWEEKLSERDIDAILIYLLKEQIWEEVEE